MLIDLDPAYPGEWLAGVGLATIFDPGQRFAVVDGQSLYVDRPVDDDSRTRWVPVTEFAGTP